MIPSGKRRTLSSKVDKKGRSTGSGRFVQLHHYLLRSEAWRSLSPQERAVYVELASIFDGANNGRLGLSARDAAARCNISKNTATKCFMTLCERGFIECASLGRFSLKIRHASEWRLTAYRCDRTGDVPTKSFMKWRRPIPADLEPGPKRDPCRSQLGDRRAA